MTTPADILATGQTPKGTPLLGLDELESALSEIERLGLFVQSMEAFALRGDQEVLMLGYSMLGLDGPEDWERHRDIGKAFALVRRKIAAARESGDAIGFKVWLDDVAAP